MQHYELASFYNQNIKRLGSILCFQIFGLLREGINVDKPVHTFLFKNDNSNEFKVRYVSL